MGQEQFGTENGGNGVNDQTDWEDFPRRIKGEVFERLSKVIDPELGRSITDLGMITDIVVVPRRDTTEADYDVTVRVELTIKGCPLSQTITNQINGAVSSYPRARLHSRIDVASMSKEKLNNLVADLKAARRSNPFTKPGIKTRIFAIASGCSCLSRLGGSS